MAGCWANAADALASPASLLIIDLRSIVREFLFVAFCGLLSDGGSDGAGVSWTHDKASSSWDEGSAL